jgi:hypothetical protein
LEEALVTKCYGLMRADFDIAYVLPWKLDGEEGQVPHLADLSRR